MRRVSGSFTVLLLLGLLFPLLPRLTLADDEAHDAVPPQSLARDNGLRTRPPPIRNGLAQLTSEEKQLLDRVIEDRKFLIQRIKKIEPFLTELSTNRTWGIPLRDGLLAELSKMQRDNLEETHHPYIFNDHSLDYLKAKVVESARQAIILESVNMMVWYAKDLIREIHKTNNGDESAITTKAAKATLKRYQPDWREEWAFGDRWLNSVAKYEDYSAVFVSLFPEDQAPDHRKFMGMMNKLSAYLVEREARESSPHLVTSAASDEEDLPNPSAPQTRSLREEVKKLPPRTLK